MRLWFQSTPAITGGRDNDDVHAAPRRAVSIHARHYWRARRVQGWEQRKLNMFQSTPAITGGRDANRPKTAQEKACFNPRPPLLAGETLDRCRHAGRIACFNPRPPLLAGETGYAAGKSRARWVSIHARHYWRARQNGPRKPMTSEQFQSTPAITGGRDGSRATCGDQTHIPHPSANPSRRSAGGRTQIE